MKKKELAEAIEALKAEFEREIQLQKEINNLERSELNELKRLYLNLERSLTKKNSDGSYGTWHEYRCNDTGRWHYKKTPYYEPKKYPSDIHDDVGGKYPKITF